MEVSKPVRDSPIQIGSINLKGFEIPTSVRFGGRYRLAVHNLDGGRRIIERLGPDEGEVVFQGTFSGPNAEIRVREFDSLRLSGSSIWLTWETFRRRVVVKNFVAEYHSPWWIPYKVSCVVVDQPGVLTTSIATISSLVSADLYNAISALSGSTISLVALQNVLVNSKTATTSTSDRQQVVATIDASLGVINTQANQQDSNLRTYPALPEDPPGLSQNFFAIVDGAGLLAKAINARSYVGRIRKTLDGSE